MARGSLSEEQRVRRRRHKVAFVVSDKRQRAGVLLVCREPLEQRIAQLVTRVLVEPVLRARMPAHASTIGRDWGSERERDICRACRGSVRGSRVESGQRCAWLASSGAHQHSILRAPAGTRRGVKHTTTKYNCIM